MKANEAGGCTFAAHGLRNFMYCLLKSNFTSMGMHFMKFWSKYWVRVTLWRSSTLWNYWMISRLAWSVLILGDRSSATFWMDSYHGKRSKIWLTSLPQMSVLPNYSINLILKLLKGSLLVQQDSIDGEHQLDIIVAFGQGESVNEWRTAKGRNHRTGHSRWQGRVWRAWNWQEVLG